jgi:hypothetical protein
MENGSHIMRKTQVRWLNLSMFCAGLYFVAKFKAVHDDTPWTASVNCWIGLMATECSFQKGGALCSETTEPAS